MRKQQDWAPIDSTERDDGEDGPLLDQLIDKPQPPPGFDRLSNRDGDSDRAVSHSTVDLRVNGARCDGLVIGKISEWSSTGIRVSFGEREHPALTLVDVGPGDVGAPAALMFEDGCPERPVIVGLPRSVPRQRSCQATVRLDGERLVVQAGEEIELRCGKASLRLTREGRVVIRGSDLLSRSSGRHRIKGGSVEIN